MMRILPLAHLSVEVPWQEDGWEGIHNFLSSEIRSITLQHPLSNRHPFSVLRPTDLVLPPFSIAASPRWLSRKEATEEETGVFARYVLEWHPANEPSGSNHIELLEHQQTLCDSFFSAIRPEESLLFVYARRTPLSTDNKPVLLAVGKIVGIGSPQEWETSEPEEFNSLLPYRALEHTIRDDQQEGFAFPYARLLELYPYEPDLTAERLACAIPDELQRQFKGGAELLDHDAALALLHAAEVTIRAIQNSLPGNGVAPLSWIEVEKERLRTLRGDAPGAAAALRALGIRGSAAIIADLADKSGSLWSRVEAALERQEGLSPRAATLLPPSYGKVWELLPTERKELLRLLARFSLTPEQATRLFHRHGGVDDAVILKNPWILPELDLAHPEPVHLRTIDRGLVVEDPVDERRLRALASASLQEAASHGHTLLPTDELVAAMVQMSLDPPCPVTVPLLSVVPETAEGGRGIRAVKLADGSLGLQLERLAHYGEVIRKALRQRALRRYAGPEKEESEEEEEEEIPPPRPSLTLVQSEPEEPAFTPGIGFRSANVLRRDAAETPRRDRLEGLPLEPANRLPVDRIERPAAEVRPARKTRPRLRPWVERLREALEKRPSLHPELEERARAEKVAALTELFEARFSVLVAPPNTGTTTLLRILAEALQQVTCIAPTAELLADARQVLPTADGLTIDHLPSRGDSWKNLVVFHAHLLGERELAMLLFAARGADRVILVGDPALPMPPGLGRPFVDLAEHLAPAEGVFPRVAPGFAELSIRAGKADRLRVADWFSGRPLPAGACEARDVPERFGVRFVSWNRSSEVLKRLIDALNVSLELATEADFDASVGSGDTLSRRWQVLAPYRGGNLGVDALNRGLQQHFRPLARAQFPPMGAEALLPGDKVVAVRGGRRVDVRPLSASAPLSPGELGRITASKPWKSDVAFSGHPGVIYGFSASEFPEDGDGPIALAYALSVRWGQGLKHSILYLIVPDKGAVTREMIYAAVTSSTDRVIIFHPGQSDDLFQQEFPRVTDAARRYTNLFREPQPSWLPKPGLPGEERSLGEAIGARGLDLRYQAPIEGPDGSIRWPTFRFEDAAGRQVFWEHFGPARCAADLQARADVIDWYRELDILSEEEAPWGGAEGLLVITQGDEWLEKVERLLD